MRWLLLALLVGCSGEPEPCDLEGDLRWVKDTQKLWVCIDSFWITTDALEVSWDEIPDSTKPFIEVVPHE